MRILVSENKTLMKQWNWEKNNALGVYPNEVTISSKVKIWWKCEKGHDWQQSPYNLLHSNSRCPYCLDHKAWPGYNDLATIFPEIAAEWHPTLNGDLKPTDVTFKQQTKVWWKCARCGHEWEAQINERTVHTHTGCPKCKAGLCTSFPEQAIYYYIKKVYPDAVNRYRDMFDNGSELDIYIPDIKVGIEYDGKFFHDIDNKSTLDKEKKKYEICQKNGIKLVRVMEIMPKDPIFGLFDLAVGIPSGKTKDERLTLLIEELLNQLDLRSNGLTGDFPFQSPVDVNLERDRYEILSFLVDLGYKSLAAKYPNIASEWDYEKNGDIKPNQVSPGSNQVFWWKCKYCGAEWQDTVNGRTHRKNDGCYDCAYKQSGAKYSKNYIAKNGSLALNNPELAKQWHPTLNGDLTPNDVTAKSPKKVWWLCPKCGYEWKTAIENRATEKGSACPRCAGMVPTTGVDDFATLHPDLMSEWDYEKNGKIRPNEILTNTDKKIWWKCSKCGYEWQSLPSYRVSSGGKGCPHCAGRKPIVGVDDFATLHPDLLLEWDYEKNTDVNPSEIAEGSCKKVSWVCSKCGHKWIARVCDRVKGKGCHSCSSRETAYKRWHK